MEQKLLSGIPFFEKNGIWRSNFSFVGDSSLFDTLKIRKCVTLDINFLPIDPNILSLNVSITFCLSFGVLIHKICGSSSFLIFFNPQNLQKQFFPLSFFQSTGRRGTFLSEEQICNCAVVPSHNAKGIKVKFFKKEPEIKIGAALQIFLEKENVPLLPSHRENLYLYLLFIGKPPA